MSVSLEDRIKELELALTSIKECLADVAHALEGLTALYDIKRDLEKMRKIMACQHTDDNGECFHCRTTMK